METKNKAISIFAPGTEGQFFFEGSVTETEDRDKIKTTMTLESIKEEEGAAVLLWKVEAKVTEEKQGPDPLTAPEKIERTVTTLQREKVRVPYIIRETSDYPKEHNGVA